MREELSCDGDHGVAGSTAAYTDFPVFCPTLINADVLGIPIPEHCMRAFITIPRVAPLLAIAVLTTSACSPKDKAADTSAAPATGTPAPAMGTGMSRSDSMGGMKGQTGMQGMPMTGDADRDFLRMMSDHHKGMIEMAHMTKDRKGGGASAADAAKIDSNQDAELDKMMTMLEKTYKDPYTPKVIADNQAMVDELKGKSGADYERTFYQKVIAHHEEAIKMVDSYLPKSQSAAVKAMAEKMKVDQSREIAAFQKKLGRMK